VRRYDYEALFAPHEMESFVAINDDGQFLIRQLTAQLAEYDWASLTDDVLGSIFEHLIPQAEQILLGQFYTPRPVADFLTAFAMDGDRPMVLDPGCGSGTFLMSAYGYLQSVQRLAHRDLLPKLWGFDISPFAAELAVINLYRQDLSEYENFPRVVTGSYFDRSPGQAVQFPAPRITAGGPSKVDVPIPLFDCILANPPYVRSQHQDDLDASYRGKLFTAAAHAGVAAAAKTDLFAFFLYQSIPFMAPGARLGFVTSASWLTADFAAKLQATLMSDLRLIAVIGSERESFFTQVDVNTVLLIAEKPDPEAPPVSDDIRFITLKKPLAELASDSDYWRGVMSLVDELESLTSSTEDDRYRAKLVGRTGEMSALTFEQDKPRNWSKYLRAPLSYYTIFGDDHDC
jgi:type I restriction-modification system DNA methylase subunit